MFVKLTIIALCDFVLILIFVKLHSNFLSPSFVGNINGKNPGVNMRKSLRKKYFIVLLLSFLSDFIAWMKYEITCTCRQ